MPKNIESILRLSPMQEGILYHTLRDPDSGVYFNQYACCLEGKLDTTAFRQAWQKVAERHAILRTFFTWERRDQPLQIVRNQVTVPFKEIDWTALSSTAQIEQFEELLAADRDAGLDLSVAPVMRISLIDLGLDRHRFIWSFHHLVLDGWSMRLVFSEVLKLYEAELGGAAAQLPPVRPFGDFISWLGKQPGVENEAFWRGYLADFKTPTQLPVPAPAPSAVARGYGQQSLDLSPSATKSLQETARKNRLTIYTLVSGAWALLLSRYRDIDDVVFGATLAGRPPELVGVERMAGLFINTLPLRVNLRRGCSLRGWLGEIQTQHARIMELQHTSLVDVQRWSDVGPGTSLFESIVVFENVPPMDSEPSQSGLQVNDVRYLEYSNYPLALLAVPGDQLRLIIIHDRSRCETVAARRLLDHLRLLLESMSRDLESPLEQVSLLTTEESHKQLHHWNNTARDFPRDRVIHQLFEEAAQERPRATAASCEEHEISYQELDARANQLAHRLVRSGVGRGDLVPLCLERSVPMVVSILGVLKAGAAYVPLDPSLPRLRLAAMLQDLVQDGNRPLIVLTSHKSRGGLTLDPARTLCVDDEWQAIQQEPITPPECSVTPDDLAYVMYTSGSTGHPKGVMVTHRNLVHSTFARTIYYEEQLRSFLLLSSYATDSSVAGLFWSLTRGAELVLPRPRGEQDVEQLSRLIADKRVSHLLCSPKLYDLLLEHVEESDLRSLRVAIVAGEACPPAVVRRHHERLDNTALYNEYGPTEATVWATVAKLDQPSCDTVPIGRPIPNTRVYVLDSARRPLPVGVPGELYIGGEGIVPGYLNRPDLTEERFESVVLDRDGSTERLYRTGDIASYDEEGNLEFHGRVDNQIKVRGYRIELEEIECALAAHPSVREVAVIMSQPANGEDSNVTFLVDQLQALPRDRTEQLLSEVERLAQPHRGD